MRSYRPRLRNHHSVATFSPRCIWPVIMDCPLVCQVCLHTVVVVDDDVELTKHAGIKFVGSEYGCLETRQFPLAEPARAASGPSFFLEIPFLFLLRPGARLPLCGLRMQGGISIFFFFFVTFNFLTLLSICWVSDTAITQGKVCNAVETIENIRPTPDFCAE